MSGHIYKYLAMPCSCFREHYTFLRVRLGSVLSTCACSNLLAVSDRLEHYSRKVDLSAHKHAQESIRSTYALQIRHTQELYMPFKTKTSTQNQLKALDLTSRLILNFSIRANSTTRTGLSFRAKTFLQVCPPKRTHIFLTHTHLRGQI